MSDPAGGGKRDPRLTPARSHVAASHLRGVVEAERFSEGWPARVAAELLDLKSSPRSDSGLSTQLLHGEAVTVYDEDEGWAFVQAERDGYVGYVLRDGLDEPVSASHRVVVARTFVYPAADMKCPIARALPLDARVAVAAIDGRYARLDAGGFVWADHLAPTHVGRDFVTTAEALLGTPYLWGGKSAAGIDCSGLVQLAASLGNLALPRDTDMQVALPIWHDVPPNDPRCRGDLVFWPGHVGIMTDAKTLLHANGHHMLVVREAFEGAERRIASAGGGVAAIKRLKRDRQTS